MGLFVAPPAPCRLSPSASSLSRHHLTTGLVIPIIFLQQQAVEVRNFSINPFDPQCHWLHRKTANSLSESSTNLKGKSNQCVEVGGTGSPKIGFQMAQKCPVKGAWTIESRERVLYCSRKCPHQQLSNCGPCCSRIFNSSCW